MLNRRDILKSLGAGSIAASLPSISYANTGGDARLVLIILRGAVDGLAMVPPYGENRYSTLRGELSLTAGKTTTELLKLDAMFGLHPSMTSLFDLYRKKELLPIHAIASPYRERSHFDGQDILENGATRSSDRRDGWLNRAVAFFDSRLGSEAAIALSQNTPMVLRGANSVTSWAPSQLPDASDDTLRRIAAMYSSDEFFATRLAQALDSQRIAGASTNNEIRGRRNARAQSKTLMQAAGRFLNKTDGPRIAVIESGGWDTHANQGADRGSLASKLSALDKDIALLRTSLGDAWSKTVVTVVTEFGRTVKVNGTRGTDHGTATAALLMGGPVRGGKILSDWPGLAKRDLYEGRDLLPTTDLRSLFKGILSEHLQLPDNMLENDVFPGSRAAKPLRDIVNS